MTTPTATAAQEPHRGRIRLAFAVALLAVLLAGVIVPPLVGIGRYKVRIASLISASLGRPVRLSSVELRLLPRPGFVLTDLTVEEDPAYGAEPVLHANTVTASIQFSSLWRGLAIGTISVDEASLNLVRTGPGRWNVESLFRSAAQTGAPAKSPRRLQLPYLEATNSRINVKNGVEKLPYSLVNSDLSFWQESSGEWRLRVRGQPARTDVNLDLADTGTVRLEATIHRAPALLDMPMHVDMEWREAQLGQLTRLLIGSDPGWRGDLTAELHLDGTPNAAQIKTRLRAAGVHRAEFAPSTPLDFDANCSLLYHYSSRGIEALDCDSPLGDGRIHVTGSHPGNGARPQFSVELDRLPVDAAFDVLRTVRNGFAEGLQAAGTVSGHIAYAPAAPAPPEVKRVSVRRGKSHPTPPGPFTGSFAVQGFELVPAGGRQPFRAGRFVIEPVSAAPGDAQNEIPVFTASAQIPAGAAAPLVVSARIDTSGYQLSMHGQATMARLSELAQLSGLAQRLDIEAITGEPSAIDLSAEGPWMAREPAIALPGAPLGASSAAAPSDRLSGTVTLHNAAWRAAFLANPLEISQATLQIDGGSLRWDPVAFVYGPIKGTASFALPGGCGLNERCLPAFQIGLGTTSAAALEAAILGAQRPDTLLSSLIARLSFSGSPAWPELEGTVRADSLVLGPVTLDHPAATLHILPDGADISDISASLMGGSVHGTGSMRAAGANGNTTGKAQYTLGGQFQHLSPAAVGKLLGVRASGAAIEGSGSVTLSGFTAEDLASSAKGTLHFEWLLGSIVSALAPADSAPADSALLRAPASLARFDRWVGDADIASGAITLNHNQVQRGRRQSSVAATLTLTDPPRLEFPVSTTSESAKR